MQIYVLTVLQTGPPSPMRNQLVADFPTDLKGFGIFKSQ